MSTLTGVRNSGEYVALDARMSDEVAPEVDQTNEDGNNLVERGNHHIKNELTLYTMVKLNAFHFGYHFSNFLVGTVIVPEQIVQIVGNDAKGTGLSTVTLVSGIFNLFVAVVFGALNDRSTSVYGRRRPSIVAGTLMLCISLFFLWGDHSLAFYTIAYVFLTFSIIVATTPYQALISDVTHGTKNQGMISSLMGAATIVGYLFGAIVGTFYDRLGTTTTYVIISLVVCTCCMITCSSVTEKPVSKVVHQPIIWRTFLHELLQPLLMHHNFRRVVLQRFICYMGSTTIQSFLQYALADCIVLPAGLTPQTAVSVALIPLLALAPISALLMPKRKRKPVVYFSLVMFSLTCLIMLTTPPFWVVLFGSGVFGIGFGLFLSVEAAMALDTLPSSSDAGRDLSLWHSSSILPSIIGVPIAGGIRDFFQSVGDANGIKCLGYRMIYSFAIVYFMLGGWITSGITAFE
ncbi:hypothetical protein SeMB42_g03384 [Synchytrium endobioticum]|uniref:Major facilitator superfamily (MFS) profile domain-containing protein n=1 Tax=Synchytrium endobioticum TaxID=286115 RepID=A0A507D6W3_9FUNG|nr:hypothetical protein SeMB42_g03384 [Synchytrium endobioticum]